MSPSFEPDGRRAEPELSVVVTERRALLNLAYRLLGSLAEAEDAVQETYTRFYALTPAEREAIVAPAAWLTRVAGRICLDVLRSARARRERYVGEWIPEPVPDRTEGIGARPGLAGADPADRITLDESITMAFLVVLESLTPAERVAFVLHDVFAYPFTEVAAIVGRTPAACRQLASSARRRIRAAPVPTPPSSGQAELVREFKRAWEAKDVDALIGLLDPDVTAVADGGGLVSALLRPVVGAEEVARALLEVAAPTPGMAILERTVNGRPGLVAEYEGVPVSVIAFHTSDARITHMWSVRNPEKLRPWTGQ